MSKQIRNTEPKGEAASSPGSRPFLLWPPPLISPRLSDLIEALEETLLWSQYFPGLAVVIFGCRLSTFWLQSGNRNQQSCQMVYLTDNRPMLYPQNKTWMIIHSMTIIQFYKRNPRYIIYGTRDAHGVASSQSSDGFQGAAFPVLTPSRGGD